MGRAKTLIAVRAVRRTPRTGDRIELVERRLGVTTRGTIHYVDDLQVLIKWDDGRSQSLRPGNLADRFWILEDE